MNYLTLALAIPCNIFLFIMVLRTPQIIGDARLFYWVFQANNYPACVGCLLLMRVIIPAYLGAPLILWMDRHSFFRRMTMPEVHDLARQLMLYYGPEPTPAPSALQELTEANRDLK